MRRTLGLLAVMLAVSLACEDSTGPWDGPIGLGIVAGDGQVRQAGADSLLEAVVGQVYRDESGNVALHLFGPAPLHAQTPIGVGIPNILTQSVPVGANGLEAWVDYDTSDENGFVEYWYEPGTVAGDSVCAEIRAIVNGEPTKLAVTCAAVLPGAPVHDSPFVNPNGVFRTGADSVYTSPWDVTDEYGNYVPYRLAVDCGGCAHVGSDSIGAVQSMIVHADTLGEGTWSVVLADSTIHATGELRVIGPASNGKWVLELYAMWPAP